MDFGFIQTAAPASQPVPLTNAAASAGASADNAAAFDAALAETLASEGAGAQPPSAPARAAQPAWMFASLFTTMSAADTTEVADAPVAAEAAPVDGPVVADAGEAEDAVTTDILVTTPPVDAMPLPVVAMPPALAQPAVPQPPTTDAGAAETATANPGLAPAAVPNAPAVPADQAPVGDGRHAEASDARPVARMGRPVASAEPAVAIENAVAPATGAIQNPTANPEQPATAAPGTEPGVPASATTAAAASHAAMRVAAVRTAQVGDVAASPSTTQPAAAPVKGPDVQAAMTEVAAAVVPAVSGTETARPQTVEGVATPVTSISSQSAGQDAPMAGQEQQRGQGRPSPEFARFTAALAQVSPAAADHATPAPAAVVTPAQGAAPSTPIAPAVAVTAPTSTPAEVPGPDNVNRLVQAMRVVARPGAWEANVRLNPDHLGDVSIAVRVERNTVSAVVNAEAAGVRQWLESQEQAVRSGMAEHGLQLDRFIVQGDGQRREADSNPQQESPRQRARRSPAAGTERFEIVV